MCVGRAYLACCVSAKALSTTPRLLDENKEYLHSGNEILAAINGGGVVLIDNEKPAPVRFCVCWRDDSIFHVIGAKYIAWAIRTCSACRPTSVCEF